MSLNLCTLRALQSPAGAELLASLAGADLSEANTLRLLTDLRKRCPADLAAAALETARLRIKARDKFGERAATMFFTREALEQATDQRISRYRAGQAPFSLDLGCSIGGDTLSFAEYGSDVVGLDLDPLRLAMARANVPNATFIQADLQQMPLRSLGLDRVVFFDPARRANGRRIYSLRDYLPPLSILDALDVEVGAVKLSPGLDVSELGAGDHNLEFISLDGELKEALLWRWPGTFWKATVIQRDGQVFNLRHDPALETLPDVGISEPRAVLYEPDPAVIRSGLVQKLAAQLDGCLIDPTIAFITADQPTVTMFARCWTIEDWVPFNLKKLRATLRERGIGRVTVKKRGSPITPEELIARLRLPGDGLERVLVLTHVKGNPAVIICQPLMHKEPNE